jgi:Phage protein Gp19/Gp15/Gp42
MAYAKAVDVQAIYGKSLTTEETALVERRLEQVERKILRGIPDLEDQITAGTIDQDDVVDIEAEAVLRVIRNPEGLFSEQDGSYGYQLSREAADNSLRITTEEWVLLGVKPSRMFQISPGRGGVAL